MWAAGSSSPPLLVLARRPIPRRCRAREGGRRFPRGVIPPREENAVGLDKSYFFPARRREPIFGCPHYSYVAEGGDDEDKMERTTPKLGSHQGTHRRRGAGTRDEAQAPQTIVHPSVHSALTVGRSVVAWSCSSSEPRRFRRDTMQRARRARSPLMLG